jgi:hypothetical protein
MFTAAMIVVVLRDDDAEDVLAIVSSEPLQRGEPAFGTLSASCE